MCKRPDLAWFNKDLTVTYQTGNIDSRLLICLGLLQASTHGEEFINGIEIILGVLIGYALHYLSAT